MKTGAIISVGVSGEIDLVFEKHGELTYIEHLVKRIKKIPSINIIITTTPANNRDELGEIASKHGLRLFVDSETDDNQRLLNVVKRFNFACLLDIPGLYTALGIHFTKDMLEHHLQSGQDMTIPINFPVGAVPVSILSAGAIEKIVSANLNESYQNYLDSLSSILRINSYQLNERRTFFETVLILNSKAARERINFMLDQRPVNQEDEKNIYIELNIKDKFNLFFQRVKNYLIEPTNHCNLRCSCCAHGNNTLRREKGFMTLSDFKVIVSRLPKDSYLTMFGMGEPFINKEIYNMVNHCENMYTYISSNGHFFHSEKNKMNLINSKLDKLIIAIDGVSEETYAKYRKRGMYTRIIKDIEETIKLRNKLGKTTPRIEMQFILFNFNEHELEKAEQLANSIGMDGIVFKTGMGANIEGNSLSRKRQDRQLQFVKGRKPINPFIKCLQPMIFWNGDYSPCCYLYNDQRILGNLVSQSIEELKNTSKFREFAERRASMDEKACTSECYCFS